MDDSPLFLKEYVYIYIAIGEKKQISIFPTQFKKKYILHSSSEFITPEK